MEELLHVLQDLVMLTLATIGIGMGFRIALGNVRIFRQPILRFIATILFLVIGFWVFYTGIRHAVSG